MSGQKRDNDELALVLGGGGAHAAYQVGFLKVLADRYPDLDIPILTGVSAGAINAVFLANHPGSFASAVDDLSRLWCSLTIDKIFHVHTFSLLKNLFLWQFSLISGGMIRSPTGRGLVDSAPLRQLLEREFRQEEGMLRGIRSKLDQGRLKAIAVTATDYRTDRAVTWIQGRVDNHWNRSHRYSKSATLTVDHVMASTALPLFFRAIQVDKDWFGDGGIRQTSPLSPALHLGAKKILAVSTRYEPPENEKKNAAIDDHPPPAQIIGTLLGSIFLDLLVQDARNLERINQLVRKLPEQDRKGFREVGLFLMQPSRNIGELSGRYRHNLPSLFHYLVKGLGTHKILSPDWLSLVMFDQQYLKRMMEIGRQDAENKMGEIDQFLGKE